MDTNAKKKTESVIALLDKKFPIVERLQATAGGWIGRDRLFSRDAVDHAEYVDLSGNSADDDDHRQEHVWSIIQQVNYMKENEQFWNNAFDELWDRFGFQIVTIIQSGQLTPKQQRVMELTLDGHKMVEIQLLLGFKHRSDVTRHFQRGAKRIFKLLKNIPRNITLAEAA